MKAKSKKYSIPNQLPGEKIIYFIHRHWFIFLCIAILLFFLLFAPGIIYILFLLQAPKILLTFSGPLSLLLGIYLLLVLAFGLVLWINYFFDIVIITNHRILEIEQRNLFNRVIYAVEMSRIEDISVKVEGMFATFFRFGDLEIQTAGTARNFIFHQIPQPYRVAKDISILYNRITKAKKKPVHRLNNQNSYNKKTTQNSFS